MIAAQYVEAATTSASEASPGQSKYTCICCRVKFETVELQRGHFKSEWHLYNLKRKVCSLDPIELDSFNQIQAAIHPASKDRDDDEASLADLRLRLVEVPNKPDGDDSTIHEMETDDYDENEDDWEMISSDGEDGDDNQEEYGEEEILKLLADAIDCDTCLFCNKKNSNIASNVKHMYDYHGFFFPEEKYLIDREGLLEYLGFKVGAGSTCLWCNKQFTTTQGARLHMMYKDHCKIFYDQEKAVGEFREFYDYSNQEQIEMKPIDQLVVQKQRNLRRSSRGQNDRQLVITGETNQIDAKMAKKLAKEESLQARHFKKFDSYRSKVILRTHLTNNRTTRDRIRLQNPI